MNKKLLLFSFLLSLAGCALAPSTTTIAPPPELLAHKRSFLLVPQYTSESKVIATHRQGFFSETQSWTAHLTDAQVAQLRANSLKIAENSLIEQIKSMGNEIEVIEQDKVVPFLHRPDRQLWILQIDLIQIETQGNGYGGVLSSGNFWRARVKGRLTRGSEHGFNVDFDETAAANTCPENRNGSTVLEQAKENPLRLAGRLVALRWVKALQNSNGVEKSLTFHDAVGVHSQF